MESLVVDGHIFHLMTQPQDYPYKTSQSHSLLSVNLISILPKSSYVVYIKHVKVWRLFSNSFFAL